MAKRRNEPGVRSAPDPFAWGLSLLAALFSGASYLEMRRQTRLTAEEREGEFRQTWFTARRTMIYSRKVVEEFETYAAELRFGHQEFRYGAGRMNLPRSTVRNLRRLHANCLSNAMHMADDLDEISEYLDSSYSQAIQNIQDKLTEAQIRHTYDAIILVFKDGLRLYEALIDEVGRKEGFAG